MSQIIEALPASAWQNLKFESGAAGLGDIPLSDKIITGLIDKGYETSLQIRTPLIPMLQKASRNLPAGFKLVVIEGYRSLSQQEMLWDKRWNEFAGANPDWDKDKLNLEVRKITAKPNTLANHNCGGAIDVALADTNGKLIDMGAPYPGQGVNVAQYRKKFPMFSPKIAPHQAANRTLLREAMEKAYFVWYPGEWWHYCWGDRMWAVYSRKNIYYFGAIEP